MTDGSHVTLLVFSKLNGLWEHRGQMSTLQHACAANSQGYTGVKDFWEMGCAWEVLLLLVWQFILASNIS